MSPFDDRSGTEFEFDPHRSCFERCFRAHYANVLAFSLRRVSGKQTAEDAVAETFAIAWRRRDRIPDPALPWLYAIALRVIANQYQSIRRRRNLDARLAHEAGIAASGSDPVDALDRRDAFFAAFGSLTEPEREVLRLVSWDGLDMRDAASVMGCSAGAFRVRLHRARRSLAKQLEASEHLPRERRPSVANSTEEIQ